MQRVQHAAHHRRQRHAGEIGEHDGGKVDGVFELHRVIDEAGSNHRAHDERHRQFHQDRQGQQHREQDAEDLFRKAPCAFHAIRFDFLGEKRHEGRVECTLGEKPPEGIGKAESGVESIRHRPGADGGCHQRFAQEAEDAAAERGCADCGELADETHGTFKPLPCARPTAPPRLDGR